MSLADENVQWDSLVDRQMHLWQEKQRDHKTLCPWDTGHLTISRTYGARGYRIGELVGQKLKWEVYSRKLVEYIADRSNLRHKVIADFDEKRTSRTLSQTLFEPSAYSSNKYYRHLVQVILSLADHGRAVIVGRGANFIADRKTGLHVRVTASLESRIERYASQQKVSFKEAKKKVEAVDRERAEYIRHFFHQDPEDPAHYDVVINVEHLTNEQVADTIIAAMAIKFGYPPPKESTTDSSCGDEQS